MDDNGSAHSSMFCDLSTEEVTSKIILTAIIVLFMAVLFVLILHLYAKDAVSSSSQAKMLYPTLDLPLLNLVPYQLSFSDKIVAKMVWNALFACLSLLKETKQDCFQSVTIASMLSVLICGFSLTQLVPFVETRFLVLSKLAQRELNKFWTMQIMLVAPITTMMLCPKFQLLLRNSPPMSWYGVAKIRLVPETPMLGLKKTVLVMLLLRAKKLLFWISMILPLEVRMYHLHRHQ